MAVVDLDTKIEPHAARCDLVGQTDLVSEEFCTCPGTIVPAAWRVSVWVVLSVWGYLAWEEWCFPASSDVTGVPQVPAPRAR